ncbi:MAG TPA: LPS assembly protein LptD [Terriglobales bacterium]|nr:LPS assembly protein LptD [Terriglobales bacterium]
MISRTRLLITAAFVCHLLLNPRLVTSQLLASQVAADNASSPPFNAASVAQREEITIKSIQQEKNGSFYTLRGAAEIRYGAFTLYADEISYNDDTGEATAEGHVVLEGGPNDEHIEASRGTYNLRTESGQFYDVVGTIGVKARGGQTVLTSSNPFAFFGKVVEKTGPDHFVVRDGSVTTCELPRPKWAFNAHKVVVDVGGNAQVYRSSFQVKGVPVFYFPYAAFPAERMARKSGFLIPNLGRSSVKGTIVGDAYYWAINRSMDALLDLEYFSQRGWSQRGAFRARPSDTSFVDFSYFGVIDRKNQGGQEVRLDGEGRFRGNFRAVANIDYLSSFVFRLAFTDTFTQAANSEVKSQAFLSNTINGFSYNAQAQRYQNFQSTQPGDVITILHAPSFEASSVDRQLGHSPFYWFFDAAGEGLSRSEPGFHTAGDLVGRFDLSPGLAMPLLLRGWSLRPELSLRDTIYTQQLMSNEVSRTAVTNPINRKSVEGSVELRPPALSRVFDRERFGRKWKHVIEPRTVYRYVTGVDNFANILRFDARDILSNTNEVEYGVINRLYAKRSSASSEDCATTGMSSLRVGAPAVQTSPWERLYSPEQPACSAGAQVREIVTWQLTQKYFFDPSFGGALMPGHANVLTTTADLTGIAFLNEPRHLSPLISRLRVQTSSRSDAEWDLDYDFQRLGINSSMALANFYVGPFTLGGGDAYVRAAGAPIPTQGLPQEFHQFRVLLGYGHLNKRGFSGAASVGVDAKLDFLQYATAQTTYNWDCCGLSFEYRRFALGSVRNENEYRLSFSLANIGSLGNMRKQERLY